MDLMAMISSVEELVFSLRVHPGCVPVVGEIKRGASVKVDAVREGVEQPGVKRVLLLDVRLHEHLALNRQQARLHLIGSVALEKPGHSSGPGPSPVTSPIVEALLGHGSIQLPNTGVRSGVIDIGKCLGCGMVMVIGDEVLGSLQILEQSWVLLVNTRQKLPDVIGNCHDQKKKNLLSSPHSLFVFFFSLLLKNTSFEQERTHICIIFIMPGDVEDCKTNISSLTIMIKKIIDFQK